MHRLARRGTVATLFAALALVVLPLAAHAQCGGGTVAPGGDLCLQPFYATQSVTATGVSDAIVVFSLNESGSTLCSQRGTSFSCSLTGPPAVFPGYFLVCAHRNSNKTTSANVTLCISN